MKRADRLLALVQILRRHRHPVTARQLAREVEVSERTLYRDIAALGGLGAPIRGEAGIGYQLDPGYDLPPLMFTPDELEALMLGARFVQERGDPALMRAVQDAVAKIITVLPKALRPVFSEAGLFAPLYDENAPERIDFAVVRRAIRDQRKLDIVYVDESGRRSERRIWPLAVGYFQSTRVIVAWCELRGDFRHFRADRVEAQAPCAERYGERRQVLLKRWEETRGRGGTAR